MILAMDVGNTHIKVGGYDNERLAFVSRLQTNTLRTKDEYTIDLLDVFRINECNPSQFDGAIISSVVPPLSLSIKEAVTAVVQTKRVYLISHTLDLGMNIAIDDPASMGSDLICTAVAAMHKYPLPVIIISLGTATTITCVDVGGNYIGGAVAAGVGISLETLSNRASQLPHISLDSPGELIAKNTVESMKSGMIYGTASMLDGMVGRMKQCLEGDATVVACGGLVHNILAHCTQQIIIDEDLVLEGLRLLYRRNAK